MFILKKYNLGLILVFSLFLFSCLETSTINTTVSPDKSLKLEIYSENNNIYYSLYKNNIQKLK